ncbi:protein of unknown function [Cupriavidus taiwanensis]|uniref:Uncharacterized protein n=1 Tax=Cupriavidus taiwanensis TaxID=164546 RepID=A0A375IG32_9BURK|nr:protein of unknown function [Cupriavidus taiwanensis]
MRRGLHRAPGVPGGHSGLESAGQHYTHLVPSQHHPNFQARWIVRQRKEIFENYSAIRHME